MEKMNFRFDDLEIDEDGHRWTSICKECKNKYSIPVDWLDDVGSGKCMIHGCENEADYYLDFPDDAVVTCEYE